MKIFFQNVIIYGYLLTDSKTGSYETGLLFITLKTILPS
jgi:hypothetical protein